MTIRLTDNIPCSLTHLLTGCTPGETLTVVMHHRVSATGTATIDYRSIALQGAAA
jgi:hypothetical protein